MEVCRACMSTTLNLVDIFSEQTLPNDQSSLADMVNNLVAFKVIRDDLLPQKMCESCCINVQIAFRFKLKFEQCYQLLTLQIKQIQLDPLEIKIEVDSEVNTTRQNVKENPSPKPMNSNHFESRSGVSLSRRTSDVEVDFITSSIDGSERPASSSSELVSVHNMEGESSTKLMDFNVTNLDNAMELENASLESKELGSGHNPKHNGQRPYKCEQCSKTFILQHSFNAHMKSHTGEHRFQCSHCKKCFTKKSYLKAHILTHISERPFKCSYCDKGFIQQAFLKMHMRTHTGERPYKCEECQLTFSKLFNLRRHKFQHTEKRPYSCDQCPNKYIEKHSLDDHMKSHTGERPFKCSYCDKTYRGKAHLNKHIRVHTGELPYKCEECLTKYTQWSNLDEKERKLKDKPSYKMAFNDKRQFLKHIQNVHKIEMNKNVASVSG